TKFSFCIFWSPRRKRRSVKYSSIVEILSVLRTFAPHAMMNSEMSSSMHSGRPESDFSIECFQNYTAPEVFVQGLAGLVNQTDVEVMIRAQKQMLQRFEKTNEMLLNCNALSASRLKIATDDFKKHTKLLHDMKKDLDYIFRKIRTIKTKIGNQYPAAFAEAEAKNKPISFDEEDEIDTASRAETLDEQKDQAEGSGGTTQDAAVPAKASTDSTKPEPEGAAGSIKGRKKAAFASRENSTVGYVKMEQSPENRKSGGGGSSGEQKRRKKDSKMSHTDNPDVLGDDDDWFNKDEDDYVVEIPNKSNDGSLPPEDDDRSATASVREMLDKLKVTFKDDGENYIDSFKNNSTDRTANFNLSKDAPGKYVQTIPLTKLKIILENDPLSMFADICVEKEQFVATLAKKTYGGELLLVLLKVMNVLGSIPLYETIRQFFRVLLEQHHFFDQLTKFLQQPEEGAGKKKKKTKVVRPTVSRVEMRETLLYFLVEARRQIGPFRGHVRGFCESLKKILPTDDTSQLERLNEVIAEPAADHPTKRISIYPTIKELNDDEGPWANLEHNLTHGAYRSVDHYLEVHLNLLKEDFLMPIRTGLEMYRKSVVNKGPTDWSSDGENIRIHYPVKLLLTGTVSKRTAKDKLLLVDLDPGERGYGDVSARYHRLALQETKRFLIGSMVLFSSGPDLNDLIVAVVSNRDELELRKGYIHVELIRLEDRKTVDGHTSDGVSVFNRPLLMVESDIFFEPYHQTFNALARLREDNFPLKSYIVDLKQPEGDIPGYVPNNKAPYAFRYGGIEFDLKTPNEWPAKELASAARLNESQFAAYRMALTSKFALIQGPPGTGKTFVGLRIVKTLLANTPKQILLICRTNHALDQFLCGVLRYTQSVVRMGGQSKNPQVNRYTVNNLLQEAQADKRVRTGYYNATQECLRVIERFETLQRGEEMVSGGISEAMSQCMQELVDASRRLNEMSQLSTMLLVKDVRVVAMTTTFAARNRTLLELLRTPIVVIEEAAEVLEADIVSSLTQHTAQCILIGDHKQLRPTTSTYVLSARYHMDLSLFERMINNRFRVATMTVQHRMRPEMADLLRPTIYPVLTDDESVRAYADVAGMGCNLFFVSHTMPEDGGRDEKSKKNLFECRFLIGLCRYLLAPGTYAPKDIVILTAYNGQLQQLLSGKQADPALHGVRIAVIDNYQGEESRIVLLSLVRSSSGATDNTIGFLAHENRICVALSRAREGLYIVGNMTRLARCSKTWANVECTLRKQAAIGDTLPLRCVTHGQTEQVTFMLEIKLRYIHYHKDVARFGNRLKL
uniref:KxDL domain-containing protein n=1 Tax=Anopheles dirus TaxID=7168 RepID=A0A182N948_9DIPT